VTIPVVEPRFVSVEVDGTTVGRFNRINWRHGAAVGLLLGVQRGWEGFVWVWSTAVTRR